MSGVGVGWLIGLSASPVVQSLLAAILGILTALVAGLSGLELPKSGKEEQAGRFSKLAQIPVLTAVPFGLVLVGVIGGSAGGIFCRENDLLGFRPGMYLERWKSISAADREKLIDRLIDKKVVVSSHDGAAPVSGSVLESALTSRCDELAGLSGERLRKALDDISDPAVKRALTFAKTDEGYLVIKAMICPGK